MESAGEWDLVMGNRVKTAGGKISRSVRFAYRRVEPPLWIQLLSMVIYSIIGVIFCKSIF